jgi:hypothetical protein
MHSWLAERPIVSGLDRSDFDRAAANFRKSARSVASLVSLRLINGIAGAPVMCIMMLWPSIENDEQARSSYLPQDSCRVRDFDYGIFSRRNAYHQRKQQMVYDNPSSVFRL